MLWESFAEYPPGMKSRMNPQYPTFADLISGTVSCPYPVGSRIRNYPSGLTPVSCTYGLILSDDGKSKNYEMLTKAFRCDMLLCSWRLTFDLIHHVYNFVRRKGQWPWRVLRISFKFSARW